MRHTRILKACCYLLVFILSVELIFINFTLLWLFFKIKNEINVFNDLQDFSMANVLKHFKMDRIVYSGKRGGFATLIKETLGRIHTVSYPAGYKHSQHSQDPQITFFGIDVSQNLEASLLIRRINSRETFPYTRMIVDIGTNDGLVSSNSFNFIQWGWSAVLVEPQSSEMSMAKINTYRYVDPFNDHMQNVSYVQGVVGSKNGIENFVVTPNAFFTESHLHSANRKIGPDDITIQVPSLTVLALAIKYKIPKNFGILSIDAEGASYKILKQWMVNDYRPAYIIYEKLREIPLPKVILDMQSYDYRLMTEAGWNVIFEHQPKTTQKEDLNDL